MMSQSPLGGLRSKFPFLAGALVCTSLLLSQAATAVAEPTFVSGFAFVGTDGAGGIAGTSTVMSDDNFGSTNFGGGPLSMDLSTFTSLASMITMDPILLTFGVGPAAVDVEFLIGPASHTAFVTPPSIVGGGAIQAEISGIGTNTTGQNLDHFIGGSFLLTYNGAKITPQAGGGIVVFGPVASSSFTLAAGSEPIPEPSTLALFTCGAVGSCLIFFRRRRKLQ
jgi:hypothetical protein